MHQVICPSVSRGRGNKGLQSTSDLSEVEAKEIAAEILTGHLKPFVALSRRLMQHESPELHLPAARLYLNLTRLTAGAGCRLFDSFAFSDALVLTERMRRKGFNTLAQPGQKRKARNQKNKATENEDSDEFENEADAVPLEDSSLRELCLLVDDLTKLLNADGVSISSHPEAARMTAETAAALASSLAAATTAQQDLLDVSLRLVEAAGDFIFTFLVFLQCFLTSLLTVT